LLSASEFAVSFFFIQIIGSCSSSVTIGGPFKVERLSADELKSGTWTSTWVPRVDHPSIPKDQIEIFSKLGTAGILLAIPAGALAVTDEWNRLLPDYKFTQADEFLSKAWHGKP
jgi:hypothetical protein